MNPFKVAVIGQGYVGLPISIAACNAGFSVLGIDTDKVKIQKLASGKSGIEDIDDESLKNHISTGKYEPTSSYEKISECKIILICVPTPLTPDMQPDLSAVLNSIEAIAKNFLKDSLIIVESTVGPGTTRDLLLPLLENHSGRTRNDFHLAFSPERIDPLNKLWNLSNTPKIVAGLTAKAGIIAKDFYEKFIEEVVLVDTLEVAEIAKLLENSFRLINISFINELAMFCSKLGVDINEIIAAASTKPYGFMPFYPSIGVGGHCIPVDPIYLATKAKEIGSPTDFIDLASRVNLGMPGYFVGRAEEIVGNLKNKRVLVVGVSYKPNVSDVRETPVKDLITRLVEKGAKVSWHDELVKKWEGSESVALSSDYDLVILATPHSGVDLSILGKTPILNTRSSV
jgi:UDP-N-acetyl-D-glucosamine dehydrogenase